MNLYRKTAIITGILFIIATAFGIASIPLSSFMNNQNYLINAANNEYQLITGVFFLIIMSFACAAIAIWLYPVLKTQNQTLALGSVCFRIMEAVFHIISAICLIALLTLSKQYIKAVRPDTLFYNILGTLLFSIHDVTSNLGLISWHIGAYMYYYVFYKSNLIPRWISIWGIIGIILAIISSIMLMYNFINQMSLIHTILNIPIGIQEMFFAVWIISKGFNPSVINSTYNKLEQIR
jgi:hypothetical protein